MFSVFKETTAATIATIPRTEIKGRTFVVFLTCFLNKDRMIRPPIMGSNTIFKIDKNISPDEILSHWLANRKVSNGVNIGAKRVEQVVMVTDKAVFPLAK